MEEDRWIWGDMDTDEHQKGKEMDIGDYGRRKTWVYEDVNTQDKIISDYSQRLLV